MMKKRIAYLFVAFLVLGLVACSGKKIDGTYHADMTTLSNISEKDKAKAKLIAAMMKLSLTFKGDDVSMSIFFMGRKESKKLKATYNGNEVKLEFLKKKFKPIVLVAKSSDRLECKVCPKNFPGVWKKGEPGK